MKTFRNLQDLFDHISFDIMETLETDVLELVQQTQVKKIYEEVYYTYRVTGSREEPFAYIRREGDGGLADESNIIPVDTSISRANNSISTTITNVTRSQPNPKSKSEFYLAPLVEYGDGFRGLEYAYQHNRDGTAHQYLQSRPFTYETVVELEQTNNHTQALKNGLRKRGYQFR